MTELETKIWTIVHNWCDAQSNEIPDQNRRYLMDEIKSLVLSHVSEHKWSVDEIIEKLESFKNIEAAPSWFNTYGR